MPTVSLIPLLYLLGWLIVQPLSLVWNGASGDQISLLSTVISFLLLLLLLPSWIKQRWQQPHPWLALGINGTGQAAQSSILLPLRKGLGWALGLLGLIVIPLLLGTWGRWLGDLSSGEVLNALMLLFGVGLAEELIFRGWLWGELNQLVAPKWAVIGQAAVFSLVHCRFNLGWWPMISLLLGLFLLGLALAVRRRIDNGSLWGCVGLHGGLVGGWFLLKAGLIQISPNAPAWLVGPGDLDTNPLGSLVAIIALLSLLLFQLTALARARVPLRGARNASSKGATP
ncbi:MAG: CPBP family intramembrane metalloprotease [Prochlorococcaceae cyanobacterium ETNP18_MAG_1]|nr:CPBP family intramembrane metalloprotease [Prochlorococcaceae cyanobacterium ETNP18_MAG_1]